MNQLDNDRLSGNLLVTGIVCSSHGVDGFVKIVSVSGETAHFRCFDTVFLKMRKTEDVLKSYTIEVIQGSGRYVLIKFRGVDTPEQAKLLAGAELLVPRDMACPLGKGEFYISDLCQCSLVYKGALVGCITGVLEGGSDDLLEVVLTEDSCSGSTGEIRKRAGTKTCLVPFRKEFVGKVDIAARTVELMHRWVLD